MTIESQNGPLDRFLGNSVGRLETLIEQETSSLRFASVNDLKEFNNRKAQVLVELDRALNASPGLQPSAEMKERLKRLREKLNVNRKTLKMHLDAVHEVAAMVADRIRDADSDGTYSYGIRKDGPHA